MSDSAQEIVAKALWADGNNRIGHRDWATVKNAYMAEAGHAIAALRGSGFCIVPACKIGEVGHPYHGRLLLATGRLFGSGDEPSYQEFCDGERLVQKSYGEYDRFGNPIERPEPVDEPW